MSILHYRINSVPEHLESDERIKRNIAEDLKHGLDLVLEFKQRLEKLHPCATEALIRLLTY